MKNKCNIVHLLGNVDKRNLQLNPSLVHMSKIYIQKHKILQ